MIFFKRHIIVSAMITDNKGVERGVARRVKITHKNHILVLPTKLGEVRVKIEL